LGEKKDEQSIAGIVYFVIQKWAFCSAFVLSLTGTRRKVVLVS
jgi:hypothetical protein